MIQKEFKNLWNSYVNDYMMIVFEENRDLFNDIEDVIESEELKASITEDLEDKGFSKEEIEELCENNGGSIDTLYKIIAYIISLYNDYSSKDELIELLEEHPDTDIDNYTDEDLNKILIAYDKLV